MKQSLTLLIISSILLFSSCTKEEEVVFPNTFSGNWYNTETSTVNGSTRYPVAIEAIENDQILFAYLYGFKTTVTAGTNNYDFTIPSQIIEGNSVSGSGTLVSANQINMSYVVDNGLFKDTVSSTLTK